WATRSPPGRGWCGRWSWTAPCARPSSCGARQARASGRWSRRRRASGRATAVPDPRANRHSGFGRRPLPHGALLESNDFCSYHAPNPECRLDLEHPAGLVHALLGILLGDAQHALVLRQLELLGEIDRPVAHGGGLIAVDDAVEQGRLAEGALVG